MNTVSLHRAGFARLRRVALTTFAALLATELSLFIYDMFVPGHTILLEEESGFIPWLNGGVLAGAGLGAMAVWLALMRSGKQPIRYPASRFLWPLAALALAWFATDDIMALHERVGRDAMTGLVRTFVAGVITLPNAVWIATFGPVFVAAALVLLGIARFGLVETPALARWVFVALAMWGTALFLEIVVSSVLERSTAYAAGLVIEETIEILAATILLGVFAYHASTLWRPWEAGD
jgi:hypothetical protein